MFKKFLFIILFANYVITGAMDQENDTQERKQLFEVAQRINFEQAKKMLDNAISLNIVDSAEAVLSRTDFQALPQVQKDNYFLQCGFRPQIAALLVAIGANPNTHFTSMLGVSQCDCFIPGREKYCMQRTRLHDAAQRGDVNNVQILLELPNINANARDYKQQTPLILASRIAYVRYGSQHRTIKHYLAIIELLIQHGANKELVNKRGKTATQIALNLKRDADRDPDLIGFSDQVIAKLEQTQSNTLP